MHTAIAAAVNGQPLRVSCAFCRSDHNYRGGPSVYTGSSGSSGASSAAGSSGSAGSAPRRKSTDPFPTVSERERSAPPVMLPQDSNVDLEVLLRRIIREEAGVSAVTPADK